MIAQSGRHSSSNQLYFVIFYILVSVPQQKGLLLFGKKGTRWTVAREIGIYNSTANLLEPGDNVEQVSDIFDGTLLSQPSDGVNYRRLPNQQLTPTEEEIKNCASKSKAEISFCKTPNYPQLLVNNILNENKLNGELFRTDSLVSNWEENKTVFRSKGDSSSLCNSREHVIFPKMGLTDKQEWKYILQDSNETRGYVQGISVEVCAHENDQCKFANHIPNGYTLQCRQKFVYRRVLTLSENREFYSPENILFPSSCVCIYYEN